MKYGRYRLVGQLGSGADGFALRALDDETGHECELRDLAGAQANPVRWRQLTRRLRLAALLQHPAQRRLLDMNLEHEPPFIVLDTTDAPPLTEVRHEELPWAPAQVRDFALQVGGALHEAHRLGLVHGAIGPSNIYWQVGVPAQVDFTGTACFALPPSAVADACRAPNMHGQAPSVARRTTCLPWG